MSSVNLLLAALQAGPAVLVRVERVQGSGPREVGAWMALTSSGALIATIGGGHLEFEASDHARSLLEGQALLDGIPQYAELGRSTPEGGGKTARGGPALSLKRRFALGPALGQCCGGVVDLSFELLPARPSAAQVGQLRARLSLPEAQLLPVGLFGGGHVGRAIIELLSRLPSRVQWFDSRDEVFPTGLPDHVQAEYSDPVQAAVQDIGPGSRVLIMSFSHAEDLEVLAACLLRQRQRGDLPFIGLIGSKSKWASFQARLRERGFSEAELGRVTCPIGLPGILAKQPEVIALAVVAQLFSNWQVSA